MEKSRKFTPSFNRLCSGTMSKDIISALILQFHRAKKEYKQFQKQLPYEKIV